MALALLGLLALTGAVVLFALSKNGGATAVLSVAEAILFVGFGVQVGEQIGAKSAAAKLSE